MINNKTFAAGLFSFFLLFFSTTIFVVSLIPLSASLILQYFNFDASGFATLGSLGMVFGVIGFIFGLKLFLENQTPFTKFLIGMLGLYFVVLGVILLLGTSATIITIFLSFLVISVGLAFVSSGFGVKPLSFFSKLLDLFKKMLNI